jgi:hypothetical protein
MSVVCVSDEDWFVGSRRRGIEMRGGIQNQNYRMRTKEGGPHAQYALRHSVFLLYLYS